jgi:spore photoproduct lyase
METFYGLDQIVFDARAAGSELARRIARRWTGPAPEVVEDIETFVETFSRQPDALTRGKRTLLVTPRKGPFLTLCQGMTDRHSACCGYATLNVIENCPMDCTYCILLGYLNNPLVVAHSNLEALHDEVAPARPGNGSLLRVGTGELGDSLALDHLTGLSLDLVAAVESFPDVVLELKTKTVEIENLLSRPAPDNTIVGWSLNTESNAATEDIGAPSVAQRLEAARRCQVHGYRLAFHFDPLLAGEGWECDYGRIVDALFDAVNPRGVAYISLGALRFPPAMKRTIEARFTQTRIASGELVRGWDGKLRYFRPLRVRLYRRLLKAIRDRAPEVTVYLCMESQQVWRDVFGWSPRGVEDVSERLHAGCRKAKCIADPVCAAR